MPASKKTTTKKAVTKKAPAKKTATKKAATKKKATTKKAPRKSAKKTVASSIESVPAPSPVSPCQDTIRQLAYDLWVQEGQPDGRDLAHWLTAERMVYSRV